MRIKLSTFVSTIEQADIAIQSGIDHLILEHPLVSIRSFKRDDDKTFKDFLALHAYVIKTNQDISLSVNIDCLAYQQNLSHIDRLIDCCLLNEIGCFRLQDFSLILPIKDKIPHATFHLSQEFGNHNLLSVQHHAKDFCQQTFSNEMPFDMMKKIVTTINCDFECQIQGPICIQYSPRRFMKGAPEQTASENDLITKWAQDQDYPKRLFTFHDNQHGHFMYLYFDRFLGKYLDYLNDLSSPLTSRNHHLVGLIDARGESLDYLKYAILYYKTGLTSGTDATLENKLSVSARRVFRPGFFRSNRTDRDRPSSISSDHLVVGYVVDVIKNGFVTFKLTTQLKKVPEALIIYKSNGHHVTVQNPTLYSLEGDPDINLNSLDYLKIAWTKGISFKSAVCITS